ncbi:hypothetical protein MD484_g8654, partial [Candolleomyces efflorescens]
MAAPGKQVAVSSEPPSSANQNDPIFYWDTTEDNTLFKLPRHQFTLGSDYFKEKYLADSGPVVKLGGVPAEDFRVFLKLLFPVHTSSAVLTLKKEEWLIVLALATRWRFLDFRRLAIQHLDPQLEESAELVRVGRSAYVPKWVMKGYQALISKHNAISDKESHAIGHYTTVKLYIIRHALGAPIEDSSDALTVIEHLLAKFADEWNDLSRGEMECRMEGDSGWDRNQVDEIRRLRDESEKQRQTAKTLAETEARLEQEEAQTTKERWIEEERRLKELVEMGNMQLAEEKQLRIEEEDRLKRLVETGKVKLAEERKRSLREIERLKNEQERRQQESRALVKDYQRQMQEMTQAHQYAQAGHGTADFWYLESITKLTAMNETYKKEIDRYKQLEKAKHDEEERSKAEWGGQKAKRIF